MNGVIEGFFAGHTAGMSCLCGAAAFVGDIVFMRDYGAARAGCPGGDAAAPHASMRRDRWGTSAAAGE